MKNSCTKAQTDNGRITTVHLRGENATSELIALEGVLRTVIQSTVAGQLHAIFEGVRRLETSRTTTSSAGTLLYRLPDMLDLLRVSKSTLYNWLNPSSRFHIPSLPRPFKLGGYMNGPVAWHASAVDSWVESRIGVSSGNGSYAPAVTIESRSRSRAQQGE